MRRPFKLINASEKDKYTPTIYIDFPLVKFVYLTLERTTVNTIQRSRRSLIESNQDSPPISTWERLSKKYKKFGKSQI